ncbi:MAG: hypothetical protein ABIH41_00875 [Nanoarchaeota archaeon]
MSRFKAVFSQEMIKEFRKAARNKKIKEILSAMLDKLEDKGPETGNLLDTKLHIYELKNKRPPLRLYYKENLGTEEIFIFAFDMKTGARKQQKAIDSIRKRLSKP